MKLPKSEIWYVFEACKMHIFWLSNLIFSSSLLLEFICQNSKTDDSHSSDPCLGVIGRRQWMFELKLRVTQRRYCCCAHSHSQSHSHSHAQKENFPRDDRIFHLLKLRVTPRRYCCCAHSQSQSTGNWWIEDLRISAIWQNSSHIERFTRNWNWEWTRAL